MLLKTIINTNGAEVIFRLAQRIPRPLPQLCTKCGQSQRYAEKRGIGTIGLLYFLSKETDRLVKLQKIFLAASVLATTSRESYLRSDAAALDRQTGCNLMQDQPDGAKKPPDTATEP